MKSRKGMDLLGRMALRYGSPSTGLAEKLPGCPQRVAFRVCRFTRLL
jgi:hypothetical protein